MPKSKSGRGKGKIKSPHVVLGVIVAAALVIMVAGVALAWNGGYLAHLSGLQPTWEGLNVGFYGFAPQGTLTAIPTSIALPSPFYYANTDPYNPVIGFTTNDICGLSNQGCNQGKVQVAISTPSQPGTSGAIQSVDYWVKTSSNSTTTTYEHVTASLVPYYLNINILAPKGSGTKQFQNDKLCFEALTVVYNNAVQDPDNPNATWIAGWSAPIAAYVNNYEVMGYTDGNGNFISGQNGQPPAGLDQTYTQTVPESQGAQLALYTSPNEGASIDSLFTPPASLGSDQGLASSAGSQVSNGDPLPDTRMQPNVWFFIDLNHFGGYETWNWLPPGYSQYFPSVNYNVKVYYLQFNTFILYVNNKINATLPVFTPQNSTSYQPWNPIEAFQNWWSNPLNQAMVYVTIIIILIVAVVIFLVFTNIGRASDKVIGKQLNKTQRGYS